MISEDQRPLGVKFINCFASYAHLLRLTSNFPASEKLLKSWAQGAKVGRKGAKPFMKSTRGVMDICYHGLFVCLNILLCFK